MKRIEIMKLNFDTVTQTVALAAVMLKDNFEINLILAPILIVNFLWS
jgi:hypothetical protein